MTDVQDWRDRSLSTHLTSALHAHSSSVLRASCVCVWRGGGGERRFVVDAQHVCVFLPDLLGSSELDDKLTSRP